jgi:16S rRNA (cytosine1402-N4)-methyltransferase
MIVLSYHSLEDRAVKRSFQDLARTGEYKVLTKHVIVPSDAETATNPRARSAKMRVIEKLATAESQAPEVRG